jgi:hypothetical protein
MWSLILPKRRHVVALVVFVPLMLGLLYFFTRTTEPYETAEHFLRSDGRIVTAVGQVAQVNFKFWEGFHFTGGDASFTFEVTGSKGASVVALQLKRTAGQWRVVAADVRAADGSTSRIVGFALGSSVPNLA